jgi:tetratricopeptide (TPR) repeat protein
MENSGRQGNVRQKTDWFRSASWDAQAQEDFERRLARARPTSRPQYLRIKGLALVSSGEHRGARGLFQRVIQDDGGSIQSRMALEHLGDLARKTGDRKAAEGAYRELLGRWPDLNATSGMVEVSLAELLLDSSPPQVSEAMALLDSAIKRRTLVFNSQLFRWHIALIRADEALGETSAAKRAARTALSLLDRGSQFSRHAGVGVATADSETLSWLHRLAE